MNGYRYFSFYKPYGILSQFTDEGKFSGLGSLQLFPKNVYPLGRLDADSEGLLLLSDDPALNKKLLLPENQHKRVYLIQVEGEISTEDLLKFKIPILLKNKNKSYWTKPAIAELIPEPEEIPEREPPVRFRKNIPTSWIKLTLEEGKNRQARKMTASIGFPTLRLIRHSIENLTLEDLKPGEAKEWERNQFYSLLFPKK